MLAPGASGIRDTSHPLQFFRVRASLSPPVWTIYDLRRFILNRSWREHWLAAIASLRARNLTNFGDLL